LTPPHSGTDEGPMHGSENQNRGSGRGEKTGENPRADTQKKSWKKKSRGKTFGRKKAAWLTVKGEPCKGKEKGCQEGKGGGVTKLRQVDCFLAQLTKPPSGKKKKKRGRLKRDGKMSCSKTGGGFAAQTTRANRMP